MIVMQWISTKLFYHRHKNIFDVFMQTSVKRNVTFWLNIIIQEEWPFSYGCKSKVHIMPTSHSCFWISLATSFHDPPAKLKIKRRNSYHFVFSQIPLPYHQSILTYYLLQIFFLSFFFLFQMLNFWKKIRPFFHFNLIL